MTHGWTAGVILCAVLALPPGGVAADTHSSDTIDRPKIGLALSGGGARGAAHIGVLKVLEEHRVPIDYIAGTSMGSIVGGLYASGMSVDELEELISTIDWDDALSDNIPRRDRTFRRKRDDDYFLVKSRPGISGFKLRFPPGVIDAWKIDLLLKRYTLPVATVHDFRELATPYRAVAADLETGEVVVLDRGDLALAIRASMSIPVVFAPREIGDDVLVDGGIANNLPIDVVRAMGADLVIAVDISTPLSNREQLESVLEVTGQLTTIMTRRNTDAQIATLTGDDVFIRPDLGDITTASFKRAREAVPAGVAAAEAAVGRLEELALTEKEYREIRAKRVRDTTAPVIDEVRIVNWSRLSDEVIRAHLSVRTGEPLDIDALESDLRRIYGLELFELVYYDVSEESGRTILTVTARERSWGPNYLQFGVVIFEDYESPNFNVGLAYVRTAVNRLNGEWRTFLQLGQEPTLATEFFQPLDNGLRYFVHARAVIGEYALNEFDPDGNVRSQLSALTYGAEIGAGRELGAWGRIRFGAVRAAGTYEVQVGDPDTPDLDFDTGEAYGEFYVDELDDVSFPRTGGSLRVRLTAGLEELGSDSDYEQAWVDGLLPYSVGRYTGLVGGSLSGTQDADAPLQSLFGLGGFTRLSGYEHNELSGQYSALFYGMLYGRLWGSRLLSAYAGFSAEYGNVFQRESDVRWDNGIFAGSAFFGLDTPIGPFYLAYGFAEGGRSNYYVFLGQPPRRARSRFWN